MSKLIFWVFPKKIYFIPFQNKNKIIKARRLATWKKLVEEGFRK
jgi:hypothetical protein